MVLTRFACLALVGTLLALDRVSAAEPARVEFAAVEGFALARAGRAAPLRVAADDWAGVIRAAGDLRDDLARVTGQPPELATAVPAGGEPVLIGTVGHSTLIDGLVARGRLDVSGVRGRWEAFQLEVVVDPLPGVPRALVIAGSDKRGTIYGLYELSARIGVSPWYWWADVPVARHSDLTVTGPRLLEPGPTVKYRGLFLNDEEPALAGWAREKFGGFNHAFYAKVFELMLRLRANYLWPAMWHSAFNEDDPENPRLADEYGIVMGTSHHEPMLRAQQEWKRHGTGPWNYATNGEVLQRFWAEGVQRNRAYESILTLGMRGDGDEAMSEQTNVRLLEGIVADQRAIIRSATGRPVEAVPQLWALYKEVQAYYEHGMRVPDDVTLLWCDDNWGNIRRLPTADERRRPGGAGVYYHFDYVGDPRNYKWLNTVPLTKVWEQMHLAWQLGADRIWIVNVGDLKPMEFPLEFFLRYAWRPAALPYEDLDAYAHDWAGRQFGPAAAGEVANLINGYTRLLGRRKPEMLAPETFSLINYDEADRVLAEWRELDQRARRLESTLPEAERAAYFQLVRHPIEAGRIVHELYVTAGRNRLYASQARASTNDLVPTARTWFAADAALTARWDAMLDGKWRRMMSQTHLGYLTWQQPPGNTLPPVTEVQVPEAGKLAVAIEGEAGARPGDYPLKEEGRLPAMSPYGASVRWLEVFNRGRSPVAFTLEASEPWLRLSARSGTVGPDQRINLAVDWASVPAGWHEPTVTVRDGGGDKPIVIRVPVDHRPVTGRGFVEADGCVAIEAPHYQRAVAGPGVTWTTLAGLGRGVGGVTSLPVTAPASVPAADGPRLEYEVFLRSEGTVTVRIQCAPSLDFDPASPLRLAVSLDDQPPQEVPVATQPMTPDWEQVVGAGVREVAVKLTVPASGPHVLKLWRVTPAVVLERIVIDAGGLRPSYLGPPESSRAEP